MHSRTYLQRYGKFIGRITYGWETIVQKIYGFDDDDDSSWIARYLYTIDPKTGDTLGTRATETALKNQYDICVPRRAPRKHPHAPGEPLFAGVTTSPTSSTWNATSSR